MKSNFYKRPSIMAGITFSIFVLYRKLRYRNLPFISPKIPNLDKFNIDEKAFKSLPRWGYHPGGKPMEWMNLIIIGNENNLKKNLEKAGWYQADEVTPWSLFKALVAILANVQYLHGPFTYVFIGNQPQLLSYQKPTTLNRFRQRHHARFWPTNHLDRSGKPIWIAHASYDVSIKGVGMFKFPPVHEIDGNIDAERSLIIDDMQSAGARLRGLIQFQSAGEGINAYGDAFFSDGRAAVLEVS